MDGVLIARHENEIGSTTDVAERFPDRKRTKTIDGQSLNGWFSEDFTLAEIKTLRARERLAFRSHAYDGQFQIPTLEEVIALAQSLAKSSGRTIGIYPETKHPTYFRSIQLPLEEPLLASLEKHGWNTREAPVFIQSFEQGNLRDLRKKTQVRLVQLVSGAAMVQGDGIRRDCRVRRRAWTREAARRPGQRGRFARAADRHHRARACRKAHRPRVDAAHRERVPAGRLQGTRRGGVRAVPRPRRRRHLHRLSRRGRQGLRPGYRTSALLILSSSWKVSAVTPSTDPRPPKIDPVDAFVEAAADRQERRRSGAARSRRRARSRRCRDRHRTARTRWPRGRAAADLLT